MARGSSIKVSWFSPYKSRKVIIAGTKKTIVFDDTLPMDNVKIFEKGVVIKQKNKERIWDYRTGNMMSPNITNRESLNLMLEKFFDFCKTKKKVETGIDHINRVYSLYDKVQKY